MNMVREANSLFIYQYGLVVTLEVMFVSRNRFVGNNYEAAVDVLTRCQQDPNFNVVVERLETEVSLSDQRHRL